MGFGVLIKSAKSVVFDIEDVILIFKDAECVEVNDEVKADLQRLHRESVPVYAIAKRPLQEIQKFADAYQSEFDCVRNIWSLADNNATIWDVQFYKEFLSQHNLKAADCLYFYDSNREKFNDDEKKNFWTFLNEEVGWDAVGYDKKSRAKLVLAGRLIANGVYFPGSGSPDHSMNASQERLASNLLVYLARRMCRNLTPQMFDNVFVDSPEIRNSYSADKQYGALEGALMCHECMSAWEHTTRCLLDWGIIRPVKGVGYYFEMKVNADEIPAVVSTRADPNMEMFARTIESFFSCDLQSDWDKASLGNATRELPETRVEVSRNIVRDFEDAGLVERESGKLVWADVMEAYFLRSAPPSHCVYDDQLGEVEIKEEAEDFFQRICV